MRCGSEGCQHDAAFIARTACGDKNVCSLHRDLMIVAEDAIEIFPLGQSPSRMVTVRMTPAQHELLKSKVINSGPQWSLNQWCLVQLGLVAEFTGPHRHQSSPVAGKPRGRKLVCHSPVLNPTRELQ